MYYQLSNIIKPWNSNWVCETIEGETRWNEVKHLERRSGNEAVTSARHLWSTNGIHSRPVGAGAARCRVYHWYIIGISLVGGIWSFAKHEFAWNSMETILLFWVLCWLFIEFHLFLFQWLREVFVVLYGFVPGVMCLSSFYWRGSWQFLTFHFASNQFVGTSMAWKLFQSDALEALAHVCYSVM